MQVFFEEPDQPLTRDDAREWYTARGAKIVREVECSQEAWLSYYNLTKHMLQAIAGRSGRSDETIAEVDEGLVEDRLVRKYRESFMDYVTFILKKN